MAILSRNRVLLFLAAAFAAAFFVPRPAAAIDRLEFPTRNMSNYRAWVTIQNDIKTRNLDSGWVEPGKWRKWWSGHYLTGSYYFVRFEFVDDHGRVLCDTKARVFAEYTDSGHVPDAQGYYQHGKCWIVTQDKIFPY